MPFRSCVVFMKLILQVDAEPLAPVTDLIPGFILDEYPLSFSLSPDFGLDLPGQKDLVETFCGR